MKEFGGIQLGQHLVSINTYLLCGLYLSTFKILKNISLDNERFRYFEIQTLFKRAVENFFCHKQSAQDIGPSTNESFLLEDKNFG